MKLNLEVKLSEDVTDAQVKIILDEIESRIWAIARWYGGYAGIPSDLIRSIGTGVDRECED